MAFSDRELELLYGDLTPTPFSSVEETPEEPTDAEVSYKRGKQIANIIPKAIGNVAAGFVGLNKLAMPTVNFEADIKATENFLPAFDVGESKGLGDVLLNTVAPEIAGYMIPYMGASKVLKGAGLVGRAGAIATEGLAQGATTAMMTSRSDSADPQVQGAVGGVSGMLQTALPRYARALPLAAVSALAASDADSPLLGVANFLGNMIGGPIKGATSAITAPTAKANIFDDLIKDAERALNPPVASRLNPGEFNFVDDLVTTRPTPLDSTGDLFNRAPEFELNRSPLQNDLSLEPNYGLSGLELDRFRFTDTPDVELTFPTTGLRLDNPRFEGPEFKQVTDPLLDLQSAGVRPRPIDDPNFVFAERELAKTDVTGNLEDWRTNVVNQPPPKNLLHDKSPQVEVQPNAASPLERIHGETEGAPGWSKPGEPLQPGFTRTAYEYGSRFKTKDDVARAYKNADELEVEGLKLLEGETMEGLEASQELFSKAQYLREAAEYAEGAPGKIEHFKMHDPAYTPKVPRETSPLAPPPAKAEEAPKIVKAAIRNESTGEVFTGSSHPEIYDELPVKGFKGIPDDAEPNFFTGEGWNSPEGLHDGFVDQFGKFYDREEAALLGNKKGLMESVADLPKAKEPVTPKTFDAGSTKEKSFAKSTKPQIVSTAVKDIETGNTYTGPEWNSPHADIKKAASTSDEGTYLGFEGDETIHGFIDDKGKFLTRDEAFGLARKSGQTIKSTKSKEKFQSQDLLADKPPQFDAAPTVKDHKAQEILDDSKQLAAAQHREIEIQAAETEYKDAEWEDDLVRMKAAESKLKKLRSNQSAQISPETMAILAVGGVAGLVGYQQSKGDIGTALAAGVIVAGLGAAGIKAVKELQAIKGPNVKATTVKVPDATIAEKLSQFAKDTVQTPAGMAVGGRGGILGATIQAAEEMFGLNRVAGFKDIKVQAGGFVDDILTQQASALRAVSKVKPSPGMSEASAKYLRGQLSDPAAVQNLLNSGGVIGSEGGAWSKLSEAAKANYPERWLQLDDAMNTNTKGDGVTIWHVTNSVKQRLVQGEKDALMRAATTPDDMKFADYAFSTRENFDILQNVIFKAAGPRESARIAGTMGQYVTRSHALINDPKFYPAEAEIKNAMDRLAVAKIKNFFSSVEAGPVPISAGGKIYNVTAAKADEFRNLFTPESLRAVITQQIKEIKAYGEAKRSGMIKGEDAKFQGGLFTGRKEIDEARQALLGTYTNPHEMVRDTFNKVLIAARSAHEIVGLSSIKEASGLAGNFADEIEYNKMLNSLKHDLKLAPSAREAQVLQNQINELASYIPVSTDNPAMGLFQGRFVSRHVHAQLEEALNPFGALDSVIGKGLQDFNTIFKETHLLLNPIVQARQIVQTPLMLVMGRAAHDLKAIHTAYNVVFKDQSTEIARWAIRNGALAANPIKGEFNHSIGELVDGTVDRTIMEKVLSKTSAENSPLTALKKGEIRAAAHLLYAKPDDFVRTATFIAAARREAKRLGVAEDIMHLDSRVTDAARLFMSRRTMDYANVPKWVKVGRQIPLVSPFLTYSHEIVRITKNMAADAAKGDLVSGAGLAGLATLPFLAQQTAEANLSPEDRKDWQRGQNAAQDYSRPRFKMPMSRNKDGSFNYYDISPIMPFGDFLMMGRAVAQGDTGGFFSVNPIAGIEKSPLLNVAAAQITGKDIHTQREFRGAWDRARNVLQAVTPPLTPGVGTEWERTFPEELGGRLGTTNEKTGRTNTIKGALMRNVLGINESQVKPDMAVMQMVKQAQHDIANERQYLNDVMRSNGLSKDAKEKALQRFQTSVKYITDQLYERANPPS